MHRTPDKKFRQSGNTKGTALYRSDTITDDVETVFYVEGEQDADTLHSVGAVAVSNAQGAGKVHLADLSPLKGKRIIVVADNDEPGERHAAQVVAALHDTAASTTVVKAATGKDATDHIAAGHTVDEFVPVLPDGDRALADAAAFMGRYLSLPDEHALTVLTLWAAHTWATPSFYVTPRLILDSAEPGSGKTRVLELLALLSHSAKLTLSTTTAALYRRIDAAGDNPPTVLQDEADAIFGRSNNPQSEDLRALFNAGYKRGATVDRCEGDAKNMKVREFPVFAPVALAGLAGKMPATITTRAVTIHMRRRTANEYVAEYRERDACELSAPIRDRLATWVASQADDLASARPTMPEGVRDRPAEVWEALLAIADAAGGDWPERARSACKHFVLGERPELSLGERLLRDLKVTFGDRDRMFTGDVLAALLDDDEAEWGDLWGKPLDTRRLAKELKRYGVESKTLRIGSGRAKGYEVDGDSGLGQAWERYLSSNSAPVRDNRDNGDIAGQRVTDDFVSRDSVTSRDEGVTAETPLDLHLSQAVTDGTHVTHKCGICGFPMSLQSDTAAGAHDSCIEAARQRDALARPA